MLTYEYLTTSAEATRGLGRLLGALLQPGDVVCLSGPLGAGKTQFSKGVALGLGIPDEVTSPTYTLVAEYEAGRIPFVHMDLYRLYEDRLDARDGQAPVFSSAFAGETKDDLFMLSDSVLHSIDFFQYLEEHLILFIEWPQGVRRLLPNRLDIVIEHVPADPSNHENLRNWQVTASGEQATQRLQEWVNTWPS